MSDHPGTIIVSPAAESLTADVIRRHLTTVTIHLATILLAVLVALAIVHAGAAKVRTSSAYRPSQEWQWNYKAWMPPHWIRLAQCESGSRGEPNWDHHSYYQGAFGFAPGSWDQFKPVAWWPHDAHLATPWQQWRTALRIASRYGLAEPWGCWRGDHHAWVRGNVPYGARE